MQVDNHLYMAKLIQSICYYGDLFLVPVDGAVVINQIRNSKLLIITILPVSCVTVEDDTPTMRDLNRYVVNKYAQHWKSNGLELGLDWGVLDIVEVDNQRQSVPCFQKILDKWLKRTPNATWRALEVALTNASRQQLGLDPVDDVYRGEILCYISTNCLSYSTVVLYIGIIKVWGFLPKNPT